MGNRHGVGGASSDGNSSSGVGESHPPRRSTYNKLGTSCALGESEGDIETAGAVLRRPPEIVAVKPPGVCTKVLWCLEESLVGVSKDTSRKRRLRLELLPKVSAGVIMVLEHLDLCLFEKKRESRTGGGLGKAFLSGMFGLGNSGSSQDIDHEQGSKKAARETIGQPVLVSLDDNLKIRWQSLALENDIPVSFGCIPLSRVHHTRVGNNRAGSSFEVIDETSRCLACLRSDNSAMREIWMTTISELIDLYRDTLEQQQKVAGKEAHRATRKAELADRRMKAKDKIKSFRLQGMKYTAAASARRKR